MRNLTFIIGLLLWSCGNDKENAVGESFDFSLEIDTILVDSKGEVLMAGTFLGAYDFSEDKKFLYNFDGSSHQIEVIHLDSLMLDRKIQLEKNGPNGIENPNNIFDIGGGKFVFSNFNSWSVVNDQAEKLSIFNYQKEKFLEDSLLEKERLSPSFLLLEGYKNFYSIIDQYDQNSTTIGLVNMETKTLKRINILQLQKLKKFRTEFSDGKGHVSNIPIVSTYFWKDRVLIGNNIFNEVLIYDPSSNSITEKTFESKLTPNQKIPGDKKKIGSVEELMCESEKLNSQIDFKKLNWDPHTNRFYRLSSMLLPKSKGEISYKADVFLTVFDDDLNMIGETKVEGYNKPPVTSFFKDGAIWIHENVNDELGFIRIKISEK